MIVRLPGCWPFKIDWTTSHWTRNGTHHGPQSNPRLIALRLVKLNVHSPSAGGRLWLYVRGGYALHVDVVIDRRLAPTVARAQ